MPRTLLPSTAKPGCRVNPAPITMQAADVGNSNYFVAHGNDEVIIQNPGGTPYTVTITSVPDNDGRSGDITTFSIPANTTYVWGPVQLEGWAQTNGQVYLQAANAAILFGILT